MCLFVAGCHRAHEFFCEVGDWDRRHSLQPGKVVLYFFLDADFFLEVVFFS